MVPKNLALAGPDRAALLLAPPLVWCARAVGPLARALNAVAKAVVRLLRVEPKDEVTSTFTAEEVASILAESRREGLIEDQQGLVTGALAFAGRDAGEVAVPLAELVILGPDSTPADVERAVARTGYSRFPVAGPSGELIGYLHLKDVLDVDGRGSGTSRSPGGGCATWRRSAPATTPRTSWPSCSAPAPTWPGSWSADGPDGADVVGVVFLEDMLEQLVGEVRDASRRTP